MNWFREGLRVTFKINDTHFYNFKRVNDAKLHFKNDEWFICQNEIEEYRCEKNKLGYKYACSLGETKKIIEKTVKYHQIRPLLDKEMLIKIKKEILK